MNREGEATWSLGVLVWLPTLAILTVVLIVGGCFVYRAFKRDSMQDGIILAMAWACWVGALVLAVGTVIGFYPWKAEYHQYVTKVGTVQSISKRIVGGDKINEKFVARYTDGREFGCEDTRCALVKPGDRLVLACKRTWQYAGVDGYDCKFITTAAVNP